MSATPRIAPFAVLARRLVFLALLASACLAATTRESYASHLAYGTLGWERLPPAFPGEFGVRVRLFYEFGYRATYFPTAYAVGDLLPPNVGSQSSVKARSPSGTTFLFSSNPSRRARTCWLPPDPSSSSCRRSVSSPFSSMHR
jgi:hypothetical protein